MFALLRNFLWPDLKIPLIVNGVLAAAVLVGAGAVRSANENFMPAVGSVTLIDGDTVDIGGERVRLLGIDTPEFYRPRCERELVLALKAKERLRALLNVGRLEIERHGRDRYGRTLARLRVGGGIDVGDALFNEGHALAYQPGAEAKTARMRAWCRGTER